MTENALSTLQTIDMAQKGQLQSEKITTVQTNNKSNSQQNVVT